MTPDKLCARVTAALMLTLAAWPSAAEPGPDTASPIYGVTLPAGYRSWQVISVAHEAGRLNDIRAILGNDVAVRAYRDNIRPFPDGAILARLAWTYVASAENNAVFDEAQSFVAGEPTNVQIDVKDSRKYAASGGWGYGQFENGKAVTSETLMTTCFACHGKLPASQDLVFTHYAP